MTATAAAALVEREYERLKPGVMVSLKARMAARGLHADRADLEALYNQAWHGVYACLAADEEVESTPALLLTIAERRAIDEARALRLDRRAPAEELERRSEEHDLARGLDDRTRVRQFTQGLRERLSHRERQAALLCYVHDLTRPEAARALGVSPRRMEKIMDRVSKKVGALVEDIDSGDWCESRSSLTKAYALGLLDVNGARNALALAHLADCPACRRRVLRIRGLAAVSPPGPALVAAMAADGRPPRRPRTARNALVTAGAAGALAAGAFAATREDRVDVPPPPAASAPAPTASPASSHTPSATATPRKRRAKRTREKKAARATPGARAAATAGARQAPAAPTGARQAPAAPTGAPQAPAATAVGPAPVAAAPPPPPRDLDGAGEFELR